MGRRYTKNCSSQENQMNQLMLLDSHLNFIHLYLDSHFMWDARVREKIKYQQTHFVLYPYFIHGWPSKSFLLFFHRISDATDWFSDSLLVHLTGETKKIRRNKTSPFRCVCSSLSLTLSHSHIHKTISFLLTQVTLPQAATKFTSKCTCEEKTRHNDHGDIRVTRREQRRKKIVVVSTVTTDRPQSIHLQACPTVN